MVETKEELAARIITALRMQDFCDKCHWRSMEKVLAAGGDWCSECGGCQLEYYQLTKKRKAKPKGKL